MEAEGRKAPTRHPFRKPWGSKKTGASGNKPGNLSSREEQQTRTSEKVKGHATSEDVEAGISTAADKTGNDKNNTNADDGVEDRRERAHSPRKMDC